MSLSTRHVFKFWIPLAATWMMMAVEGPFIAAVIARLGESKFNLAAYGVAFSLGLILEAPIIMMMTASTRLVSDGLRYLRLWRFTNALNIATTLATLLLLYPPVFEVLIGDLVGLPPEVAERTHLALALLLPWPAAIGVRRFYQGILIREGRTRRVAVGTVVRLVAMAGSCLVLAAMADLPGAAVGTAAHSFGVVAEALAIYLMTRSSVVEIKKRPVEAEAPGYVDISRFYYPLALTSLLSLAVHPIVTFFVGLGVEPVTSLAVLPVVTSLIFIFRCAGLSFQEVAVALMGENAGGYGTLRRFATGLGIVTTGILALIAFTPLSMFWFQGVSGLTDELAQFAVEPLQIMFLMAALSIMMSWQRALAVGAKRTGPITIATFVEVGLIVFVMYGLTVWGRVNGAVAASLALVVGRLASVGYLALPGVRITKGQIAFAYQKM